ncbi:TIR domain-containing protein [Microbacter sp. GSS18]|nr:TIR domain-containing protein [Microbacter sp. GSS18]
MTYSVFVSYRRSNASGAAGRIYDALTARFGEDAVFMDVDGIEPGADFEQVLDETLRDCRAVVVVIDPHWTDVVDADGARRLDDPDDFVRLEVESALKRDVKVLPVLVDGARMPARADLPESLGGLATRQGLEVTSSRFKYDVGVLAAAIEPLLPTRKRGYALAGAGAEGARRRWLPAVIAVGAVALVAGGVAVVLSLLPGTADAPLADVSSAGTPTPTAATPTPTPTPTTLFDTVEIEAEDGRLVATIAAHSDPQASGGAYISAAESESGTARYEFDVATAGTYRIWARVSQPESEDPARTDLNDTYILSLDSSAPDIWDFHEGESTVYLDWTWELISLRCDGDFAHHNCDPFEAELDAGPHVLVLTAREVDARLDALVVSSDPDFRPEGRLN